MNEAAKSAAGSELVAEVVRTYGEARFRALGTSMLPAVRPGDILVVERRPLMEVEPGAIVLFERGQRLFAHRVLARCSDECGRSKLITRGDRQWHADEPVDEAEFLGQVTAIERDGRTLRPAAGPSWMARLLRLISHFTDWPAGLLVLFHRARS